MCWNRLVIHVYRRIQTIRKHIVSQEAWPRTCEGIRIDKSANAGGIVATVTDGMRRAPRVFLLTSDIEEIILGIILVFVISSALITEETNYIKSMSQINWLDMFPHDRINECNDWFDLRVWDKQYIR